jgi:hypothetical protein
VIPQNLKASNFVESSASSASYSLLRWHSRRMVDVDDHKTLLNISLVQETRQQFISAVETHLSRRLSRAHRPAHRAEARSNNEEQGEQT